MRARRGKSAFGIPIRLERKSMPKSLVEMVSEIVAAQASHMPMSPEDISEGVRKVFEVLQHLQALEAGIAGGIDLETAQVMKPQDSIQRNRVICLECNKEFKLLSNRHLALHGLTSRDYKLKYGFYLRQSLSAQSLTQARRKIAQEKGLGAKLVAYQRRRKKQERA
jgi:predicted transcriptional regulator